MISKAPSSECFVYITLPGQVSLGELDYLLESPDDRAGALAFGHNKVPPAPQRKFNKTIDLEKLQNLAEALVKDEADKIVNNMKARVEATWYETLRASGVSEKDAETIRGAFVYPGFSL